jgi:hypothetical protein
VTEQPQGEERTLAKFAHLREQRRQRDVEERGRAEVADLDDE